jgi:hypothetical protein
MCSAIGPLQLGGDGSDAPKQPDALIENGSFQIRGQWICAVLRKLILYGAEGGGGICSLLALLTQRCRFVQDGIQHRLRGGGEDAAHRLASSSIRFAQLVP